LTSTCDHFKMVLARTLKCKCKQLQTLYFKKNVFRITGSLEFTKINVEAMKHSILKM
jgi:hypothetical protein